MLLMGQRRGLRTGCGPATGVPAALDRKSLCGEAEAFD